VRIKGPRSTARLASLGPGCTVGEMGLLKGQLRSADVVADDSVTAYMMTKEKLDDIFRDNPSLGQRLLMSIARQLTQRLADTSEELRAASH
jgi:sulfate permease, SulP family